MLAGLYGKCTGRLFVVGELQNGCCYSLQFSTLENLVYYIHPYAATLSQFIFSCLAGLLGFIYAVDLLFGWL